VSLYPCQRLGLLLIGIPLSLIIAPPFRQWFWYLWFGVSLESGHIDFVFPHLHFCAQRTLQHIVYSCLFQIYLTIGTPFMTRTIVNLAFGRLTLVSQLTHRVAVLSA
jgi:hypothetical protein